MYIFLSDERAQRQVIRVISRKGYLQVHRYKTGDQGQKGHLVGEYGVISTEIAATGEIQSLGATFQNSAELQTRSIKDLHCF